MIGNGATSQKACGQPCGLFLHSFFFFFKYDSSYADVWLQSRHERMPTPFSIPVVLPNLLLHPRIVEGEGLLSFLVSIIGQKNLHTNVDKRAHFLAKATSFSWRPLLGLNRERERAWSSHSLCWNVWNFQKLVSHKRKNSRELVPSIGGMRGLLRRHCAASSISIPQCHGTSGSGSSILWWCMIPSIASLLGLVYKDKSLCAMSEKILRKYVIGGRKTSSFAMSVSNLSWWLSSHIL